MTVKKNISNKSQQIRKEYIFKIICRLANQIHSSIFGISYLNLFSIGTSACIFLPPLFKIRPKYISYLSRCKFDIKALFMFIKPKWFFKGRSTMT